jgi:hypothetical protein
LYFYPAAFGHQWTPIGFSYLRGDRLGISQAKKDIAESRAMILDPNDAAHEEFVDRRTGLRLWYMGDVTDRGTVGYVHGYNTTVDDYIARKGIPVYSWKEWEGIIFNARDYYDRQAKSQPPSSLRKGIGSLKSPYSNATITLQINNMGIYFICLDADFSNCNTPWPVSPQDEELKCVWGPEGSKLLFIKGNYCRTRNPAIGVFAITSEIEKLRFEYER